MNNELNRLNTFGDWPASAAVDPARIAQAGFFYTGQGTEVQCFSCGGKISDWNYGDTVMGRHRRLDRNCPFVSSPQSSGNVAQIQDPRCPQGNSTNNRSENQNDQLELVHNYGVTEEDEMYKSDALRLLSFVNWNDSSVSREALVSAGFYHAGEGRLRCAWCGGELARMRRLGALGDPLEFHMSVWCGGEMARMRRLGALGDPVDFHLRYFPGCAHAEMLQARDAASRAALALPAAPPRAPLTPAEPPPEAQAHTEGAIHNARVLSGAGTWRALGVVGGAGGARHPERASLAARLETFEGWPRDRTQTPQDLAEAGFYFTGTEDGVRCFYCEGGLGKWESGDTPWREHARWFPHCGYLLLVKGREFVDRTRENYPMTRTHSADSGLSTRRLNSERVHTHTVTDTQVAEQMESPVVTAALGAGLDFARIRNAIIRRLRTTGVPFCSSEALIDSVLDSQLGEEPWSVVTESTHGDGSQRLARDILAESLLETYGPRVTSPAPASPAPAAPAPGTPAPGTPAPTAAASGTPAPAATAPSSPAHAAPAPATPAPAPASPPLPPASPPPPLPQCSRRGGEIERAGGARDLQEENRQLKEARLCKVCMDGEVSVVFLPCGHLVSCAACAAGLRACPLCRAHVQALVRAYLA